MVDGTAFTVKGPSPVEVGVTEGVVRVRDGEVEERVTAGQFVTAAGGGAGVTAAAKMVSGRPKGHQGQNLYGWLCGDRAGCHGRRPAIASNRSSGRTAIWSFRLAKTIQLRAESGVLTGDGLSLPQTLELSYRVGGFAVGGRGQVSVYQTAKDCPDGCDASLWGLSASAAGVMRYSVPLSPRLVASGDLSAGANTLSRRYSTFRGRKSWDWGGFLEPESANRDIGVFKL